MTQARRADHRYHAFYCEENVWHLCQAPALAAQARRVVFVSNAQRACPLWLQRAAPSAHQPVVWDYHVVLVARPHPEARWRVWDLDTLLPFPCDLDDWLRASFAPPGAIPDRYAPRFRVLDAQRYLDTFASDRSHMRRDDGAWTVAPPPWPCIQTAAASMNLMRFVDTQDPTFVGHIDDLPGLRRRFGLAALTEP